MVGLVVYYNYFLKNLKFFCWKVTTHVVRYLNNSRIFFKKEKLWTFEFFSYTILCTNLHIYINLLLNYIIYE